MEKVETLSDRNCPKKTWGWEEWIVNNDLYCGKRLHFIETGGSTSLHFHMKKHETMYVESGSFYIRMRNPADGSSYDVYLQPGQSIVIPPGTPHRICCELAPAVLIEFSTHHEDTDSYRIEK